MSWEEFASSLKRDTTDTERLMAAVIYRQAYEGLASTTVSVIATDYFRRARWPRPTNLSATANHCASKGWLSEAGADDRKKYWCITRKGYNWIRTRLQE
jgi:hypothetical protein